eukprot:Gb_23545 [translate_table: standard]
MEEFKGYRARPMEFPRKKYDVFLSFRGPDVRKTFVDHLSESLRTAGVHFFKDDEKLEMGSGIDPSLREAIRDSKIHIPIFSKTYAHSVWCLEEVKEMCQSKGLIIPLFYDVEPSDVRYHSKGRYKEAFEELANKRDDNRRRHDEDTISAWKQALHRVSSHSGWSLHTASWLDEGKLVKRVVMNVLRTLNNEPLDVAKYPVGLMVRMEKVIELLEIASNETVITLGIWGMGGLGKTTLAKAGVNDIDHGKTTMKSRLGSIRALVVLDDIDHTKQLEALSIEDWFGDGSRVIVTTRDKHILNLAQAKIWKMKELEKDEALELFSWHAFLMARPEKDYEDVSLEVVDACGGLPLSLEVLGSFLYDKRDEKLWHQAVKQLQNLMYDDIRGRLEISYQALNPHEKEIFLDIACFFLTEERSFLFHDLEMMKKNMISFWESLAIVEEESPLELGKRSRLWKPEDARQVLQKGLGTERVRGLHFDVPDWLGRDLQVEPDFKQLIVTLHPESLSRMPNLQLLWLGMGTSLEGDIGEISSNLRWLRWEACPLKRFPSKWNIEHLLVLDLFEFGNLTGLKVLLMKECHSLCRTQLGGLPESFSMLGSLVRLDASRCGELKSIADVSHLTKLETLLLNQCQSLAQLPEFRSCHSLTEVDVSGCKQVKSLAAVKDLKSLQKLDLSGSGISELNFTRLMKDVMNSSAKKKGKCAGLVVCFILENEMDDWNLWTNIEMKIVVRESGRNPFSMDLSRIRIFKEMNRMYMYIYREDHPLVTRMETADAICVQSPNGEVKGELPDELDELLQELELLVEDDVRERLDLHVSLITENLINLKEYSLLNED